MILRMPDAMGPRSIPVISVSPWPAHQAPGTKHQALKGYSHSPTRRSTAAHTSSTPMSSMHGVVRRQRRS